MESVTSLSQLKSATKVLVCDDNKLTTAGLDRWGQQEINITVPRPALIDDANELLEFIICYLNSSGRLIRSGETMAYGYWLLKFLEENGKLVLWEYNANGTAFVSGAELATKYWQDQHELCNRVGAEFTPPVADKLGVIDDGVLRGGRIDAVRYPSRPHM